MTIPRSWPVTSQPDPGSFLAAERENEPESKQSIWQTEMGFVNWAAGSATETSPGNEVKREKEGESARASYGKVGVV